MASINTTATKVSVEDFINAIPDEQKRADSFKLVEIMERLSGEKATMCGTTIIGFGKYHYKYASGHEGEMCRIGFSPRKAQFSLYVTCDAESYKEMLDKFGKHRAGKGCIYFKKLEDIELKVLEKMIETSLKETKKIYG